MSDIYTREATLSWLESQSRILDCWINDVVTDPAADMRLVDCLETHKNWLNQELKSLRSSELQVAS